MQIIIANSKKENLGLLFSLLEELNLLGHAFFLLEAPQAKALWERFNQKKWPAKKLYLGSGPKFIFFLVLPLVYIWNFFLLLFLKKFKKINTILLLGLWEKITLTPLAKILWLKIIWLELPGDILKKLKKNKRLKFFYKANARQASSIICLNEFTQYQLASIGIEEDKIQALKFGIRPAAGQRQESIFDNLAQKGQAKLGRKFFTIGVISELNKNNNIKTALEAAKECLEVIPNLQIVVVGDGTERKNLVWLAKTLGLENIAWFVGRQDNLKKWLDSFDVLLCPNPNPCLADYNAILHGLYNGLAVIAQRHIGLGEMIPRLKNRLNSLINVASGEVLAQKIIELEQEKISGQKLGELGKKKIIEEYALQKTAEKFSSLF